jgi:hypothetical protein
LVPKGPTRLAALEVSPLRGSDLFGFFYFLLQTKIKKAEEVGASARRPKAD